MNGNVRMHGNHHFDADPIELQPSPGSRLTYSELAAYPPQSPVREEYHPVIHRGICEPKHIQVLHQQPHVPPVFLVRAENASQAYALIPGKENISLNHHDADWGCVHFACIYPLARPNSGVFRAPADGEPLTFVAIKRLRRTSVDNYLHRGGQENPYKEIALMQELGDNVHVLRCLEALEDDTFLYIVTPKACTEGTLKDYIPWYKHETLPRDRIRDIFRQILAILLYLERHRIAHRDLSPDNFLFLSHDNLVCFDLALSDRIPQATADGAYYINAPQQRTLILPHGNFGTRAWQSPEIYGERVFDGVGSDLWSVMVVLYNLFTNQVLYHLPHPVDLGFKYFILAKGLSSQPVNERTVEVLMELSRPGQDAPGQGNEARDLLNRALAHLSFGRHALELLEKSFEINPAARWTLAETIESSYVMLKEDE